jgi:diacylglycerol kinase (ATP)
MITHYAILTNPVSGRLSEASKRKPLSTAAKILDAKIHGLDVETREDFALCAKEIARETDVLVVAGGDGTVSDVINAIETRQTPIAYLPLGSGNALAYGLGYPMGIARTAQRIREGSIHEYDLIDCDGRKRAILASIGVEGSVLKLRTQYLDRGFRGFPAYGWAFFRAYFLWQRPLPLSLDLEGKRLTMEDTLTLTLAQHPYFGYGMKLVPDARFDDGTLHLCCIAGGRTKAACTLLTSFTLGNRVGVFLRGRKAVVRLQRAIALQIDGNLAWEADRFTFEVLPKALKIKC